VAPAPCRRRLHAEAQVGASAVFARSPNFPIRRCQPASHRMSAEGDKAVRGRRGRQGARDFTQRPLHDLRSSASNGSADQTELDAFLSSPLTPRHKTIPTIPVNASPARLLRFRQPVARVAGSHRLALRPGLRSSPSSSIDSSCASISTSSVHLRDAPSSAARRSAAVVPIGASRRADAAACWDTRRRRAARQGTGWRTDTNTLQAKTTITGLPVAMMMEFRIRATTRSGMGDWEGLGVDWEPAHVLSREATRDAVHGTSEKEGQGGSGDQRAGAKAT
jgi:hypothetical protein